MRVALELQPCCGARTGIGNYTYELARRLVSGPDISYQGNVFRFRGQGRDRDDLADLAGISMDIRENHSMQYGVYRRIWNIVPLRYNHMFPPADVTHFFNYIVPPRIEGTVITTIHDMTYLRYPETVSKVNLQRIRKGIAYSVERSQVIVTSSEFSKGEISELLQIPREQIVVIPAAASITSECLADKPVSEPYILYVGAIEPRKNLVSLLRAFELLKREAGIPHKLVLAGSRGWNCEDIYRTAEKIYGGQDIIFRGYVTAVEKNTLYANASAFVFPSLYEGFGIPVLEAMHWGTPVICSNAASLPEVAGEAACYVDPLSIESISEGINQVLSNMEYARQLTDAGKSRCKLFDWDVSAAKLEKLYRSRNEVDI